MQVHNGLEEANIDIELVSLSRSEHDTFRLQLN